MVENERYVDISNIIENASIGHVIRLHLAPYFRMQKTGDEIREILSSHGLDFAYDPVRITPVIGEKLWEEHFADANGFFTFPPKRLILGHTLESIELPSNIGLRMRDFFYSEETREVLPLTAHCTAPCIHPGSTGPQTYEIINKASQPLRIHVPDLVCYLDVDYLMGPSVLAQQELSRGTFSRQKKGRIELGNPGKEWEFEAIRRTLGLS